MKRFAIAALAGALTVPFSFAAQTSTPAQGSSTETQTKTTTKTTKKHHAKKHTSKKAEKNATGSTSAVPPAK